MTLRASCSFYPCRACIAGVPFVGFWGTMSLSFLLMALVKGPRWPTSPPEILRTDALSLEEAKAWLLAKRWFNVPHWRGVIE